MWSLNGHLEASQKYATSGTKQAASGDDNRPLPISASKQRAIGSAPLSRSHANRWRGLPEARRCIKRIRIHKRNLTTGDGQTDLVIDYDFYDKHPAIDRDYKRNGLLKERIEMEHRTTLEDIIYASNRLDADPKKEDDQ